MHTDRRPLAPWCRSVRPVQDPPSRKPSNWWAFEREPWRRVNAEILAEEKAAADRKRTDRALGSAFAFAGLALGMAREKAPSLVPADQE